MKATEQLKDEHQGIKLMLRIIERICDRLEAGEPVNHEHPARILEFFTVFVDKCHHGKEEDLLFPSMVEARIPGSKDIIDVLLSEHRRGREYVKAMREDVGECCDGEKSTAAAIIQNAGAYNALLLRHIDKEDNVLYPMADASLPEKKHEELVKGFEQIERERIGEGTHEAFHKLMHKLKSVYLK